MLPSYCPSWVGSWWLSRTWSYSHTYFEFGAAVCFNYYPQFGMHDRRIWFCQRWLFACIQIRPNALGAFLVTCDPRLRTQWRWYLSACETFILISYVPWTHNPLSPHPKDLKYGVFCHAKATSLWTTDTPIGNSPHFVSLSYELTIMMLGKWKLYH